MLLGLKIANFKMLQNIELGLDKSGLMSLEQPKQISVSGALCPLTVLIGNNGTGKSSVFIALSFLSDSLKHGVAFAASQSTRGGFNRLLTRGSDAPMRFSLLFEYKPDQSWLNYEVELQSDEYLRPFVKCESVERIDFEREVFKSTLLFACKGGKGEMLGANGQTEAIAIGDKRELALATYGRILGNHELGWLLSQLGKIYACELNRSGDFTDTIEQGGHKHMNKTCSNIKNVLAYYEKKDPAQYRQMMRRIESKIPNAHNIDDCALDNWRNTGNHSLFSYLLLFEDVAPRQLLCLEEPDSGLHPNMLAILMSEIRDYTMRNAGCQVILTTHNPGTIEMALPREVWSFSLVKDDPFLPNRVVARCVAEEPLVLSLHREGVGLGAMWYGGHLNLGDDDET